MFSCAGFGFKNLCFNFSPSGNIPTKTGIRILTWNTSNLGWDGTYQKQRRDNILETVKSANPDIVCFQEAVISNNDSTINNMGYILSKLEMPYFKYSYMRRDQFDDFHQFGDIVFSKFPIIDSTFIYATDSTVKHQILAIKINDDTLRLYNLHMASNKFDKQFIKDFKFGKIISNYRAGKQKRNEDVQKIIASATQHVPIVPTLLVGDFNDTPLSSMYRSITQKFEDTYKICSGKTWATWHSAIMKLRIDYVFKNKKINCSQYTVLNATGSDHYPVIVDFQIAP
ncbi:MAG: endonuclease/exonuclease/phosphatase family protein [Saprospiraceae bacterium]|nr:endonuclease/exonuclease/phosphatase family protein [Saprospiraceae bacterium]